MRLPALYLQLSAVLAGFAPQVAETTQRPALRHAPGLTELIDKLPRCALSCMMVANQRIGCEETDIRCFCAKATQVVPLVGPCLITTGHCSAGDIDDLIKLSRRICRAANNNNEPGAIASASSMIQSFLETAITTVAPLPTQIDAVISEAAVTGGQAHSKGTGTGDGSLMTRKDTMAGSPKPTAVMGVVGAMAGAAIAAFAI
ncbi:hypothetical protein NKR23_g7210 [Pleurostoma richardsiae]|uniref:CFEM domain-containing protein n=1 Tax=Pleurostoma richardsiae TaxID=41990 RepID=A0AA38VN17_9PEZI|nr:hypothetical protein NKR23_g7210 [Pleurostoma richardsiae]